MELGQIVKLSDFGDGALGQRQTVADAIANNINIPVRAGFLFGVTRRQSDGALVTIPAQIPTARTNALVDLRLNLRSRQELLCHD